jgi:hypothetical protein
MKRQWVDAHWILIIYLPIMLACSQHPETARHSLSRASDAAATFHPASGSSPFSPSPLSVPCALCGELRRYLPSELFLGRPDQLVVHQQRSGSL